MIELKFVNWKRAFKIIAINLGKTKKYYFNY